MSTPSPDDSLRPTAKRLMSYVAPHRGGLFLTLVAYIGAACTEPMIPQLLGYALGEGFTQYTHKSSQLTPGLPAEAPFSLWMVPLVLIGLFAMRGLFGFLGQYLLHRTITRTVMDIRAALLQSLLRADARVYSSLQPATAVTKVVNDPQHVITLLGGSVITILRDGLPALAMLGYLFWLNWQLTLLSMVTVPVMATVMRLVNKRVRRMGTWAYDANLRLVSVVEDVTRAWRVVRSFDAADHERQRFADQSREVQRSALKTSAANALAQPLSQLVASVGISLIVALALLQARHNQAGVGEFAAFVAALLLMTSRLRHLTDVAQPITNALVVARGCLELMDLPREPDHGHTELSQFSGRIELDQVVLRYPGATRPALDGLSLLIEPGRTTALVGSSGAGKSSVVNLLLGFERQDAGRVLLDGVPLEDLTKANLRRQFAVVSQDIVLFDASVADNIAYAQLRDDARLEQVLRAAALWDFVQTLPQGLDTPVGANGSKLSGGQRQRLAIARALYKDAPVWIFDEATSALDTESERAVQQALEQWQGHKTLLVIAHRLSTIRRADRILVLNQGQVAESGTHEELLAAGGSYAGMVGQSH
ncbi:lipid A export permease/ATP-binding protein MsbA [Pelomonas sp. CA6]|uniref:lipid A export permease/ATP-binding protein MsbA n=1 Tax=Pelomonas sp. CA6 TaxID=2907999 RepID=UPI001F4C1118|nr:lipid A export permease/ATP-binding protein MsbA [Pelomonas sp. CA6]MCH7345174.1 lipid A export permease/ATP-binding protein MsbA [Pelomonas sp. CA6]